MTTRQIALFTLFLCFGGRLPLSAQLSLPASAGTDFYVAVPFMSIVSDGMILVSITATEPLTATVELTENGTSSSRFIDGGESWTYAIRRIQIGFEEQREGRSMRSIRIRTTRPAVVHVVNDSYYFADGWLVPPVSDLGRDHRLLSHRSTTTAGGVAVIVATEDETSVRITPTERTGSGNGPGFTYGITLDRGEVWHIVPSIPERTDLTGTRIESDKPIALYGGHAGTTIGSDGATNPLLEWMPPISFWDTSFVTAPLPRRSESYYTIVGHTQNTRVWLNGFSLLTLSPGESYFFQEDEPIRLTSSHPIAVAQHVHYRDTTVPFQTGDPAMTVLVPESSWSKEYMLTIPRTNDRPWVGLPPSDDILPFETTFQIISSDTNAAVLIDGADVTSLLTRRLPGTPYRIGQIPAMEARTYRITSTAPFTIQIVGYNTYDAFLYPAGYDRPAGLIVGSIVDTTCDSSRTLTLTLRSRSEERQVLEELTLSRNDWTIDRSRLPDTLEPFESVSITLNASVLAQGDNVATLTATYALLGSSRSSTMSSSISIVRLTPLFTVAPLSLDLGSRPVESGPIDTTIVITNNGARALTIGGIDGLPGTVLSPTLPHILPPGGSVAIRIRLASDTPIAHDTTIVVTVDPCLVTTRIPLRFTFSDGPFLTTSADSLILRCPDDLRRTLVRIRNSGGRDAAIDSIVIEPSHLRIDGTTIPSIVAVDQEAVIAIDADSMPVGSLDGTIRIYYDGSNEPAIQTVHLRRDSAALLFDRSELSLTPSGPCDVSILFDSIMIVADGTVESQFDIALASGADVGLVGSPTRALQPGDSSALVFRIDPGENIVDTIIVTDLICGIETRIPIVRPDRLRFDLRIDDAVDLGSLSRCSTPTRTTVRIVNDGEVTDTITTIDLQGDGLSTTTALPIVIAPGEWKEVEVLAALTEDETLDGRLIVTIEPCGRRDTVRLHGTIEYDSLAITTDRIRLDGLLPGVERSDTTWLHNRGTSSVDIIAIEPIDLPDGFDSELIDDTRSIDPGDSLGIVVRTSGERTESFVGQLLVVYDGACIDTLRITVSGEPRIIPLLLSLPDRSGRPDEVIEIPIIATTPYRFDDEVDIMVELSWDARLFDPMELAGASAEWSATVENEEIVDERMRLSGRVRGRLSGNDTIGVVRGRILIGPSDSTMFRFDSVAILSDRRHPYDLSTSNGRLAITGICRIDGDRFILLDSIARLQRLYPNPAADHVSVTIDGPTDRNTRVTIRVFSGSGRQHRLEDILLTKGSNIYTIDVSGWDSGIYFLTLSIDGTTTSLPFLVGR